MDELTMEELTMDELNFAMMSRVAAKVGQKKVRLS